jgi:hypothetical protein
MEKVSAVERITSMYSWGAGKNKSQIQVAFTGKPYSVFYGNVSLENLAQLTLDFSSGMTSLNGSNHFHASAHIGFSLPKVQPYAVALTASLRSRWMSRAGR